MHRTIADKTGVLHTYRAREAQSENLEFGNQIRQKIETVTRQEQSIERAFISSTQVLSFIQGVESLAQNHALEITIEKVEQGTSESLEQQKKSITPVTFMIQVIGPYENISFFLKETLFSEKKLGIGQLHLFRSDSESGNEYTARIQLQGLILSHE